MIEKIIAKMILNNRFWGFIFSHIEIISTNDLEFPLAIALIDDDIKLLYNPEFLKYTTEEDLIKFIEHEGLHILNKHITRSYNYYIPGYTEESEAKQIQRRWNEAADIAINQLIKDFPKSIIINGEKYETLFPEQFKLPYGKSAEWYYEHFPEDNQMDNQSSGVSSDDSGGMSGTFRNNSNKNEQSPNGTKGKVSDLNHKYWGHSSEGINQTSIKKIEQKIKSKVGKAYRDLKKRRGTLPSYLEELVQDLINPPKIPYYEIIRKIVKGHLSEKFKRSNSRVNKKRTYIFDKNLRISPFPGISRDETYKIVIITDTSASMSYEDIMEALSSVRDILNNDKKVFLYLIMIDTKISWEGRIRRIEDIKNVKMTHGGTILFPAFERAKTLKPDIILAFTDGYCENLNKLKYKMPNKILYILTPEGSDEKINRTGFIVKIGETR